MSGLEMQGNHLPYSQGSLRKKKDVEGSHLRGGADRTDNIITSSGSEENSYAQSKLDTNNSHSAIQKTQKWKTQQE
ncbi:hypothetical protein AV530_002837 [Patagioenas fasciata monilis]|uniref:Uncharacterized protein n=1 Tax=Patagioenas fasciata monilis TaxID=372326 RepID=A0A1V4K9C7_PATFA|nr:hypothetical protein AV530_002837 [Patagioenas fasciata monilis]